MWARAAHRALRAITQVHHSGSPILQPVLWRAPALQTLAHSPIPRNCQHVYISTRFFASKKKDTPDFVVSIPEHEVQLQFARASGPGGQNVNKVNTKVDLRFHLESVTWIPDEVKEQMVDKYPNRVSKAGYFIVTCMEHRTQEANRLAAFRLLQSLIDDACYMPKERVKKPLPKWAHERRIKNKKKHSDKKSRRQQNKRGGW